MGSDRLLGGSGNDVLIGFNFLSNPGVEFDTLTGGSGADNFVLGGRAGFVELRYLGTGHATITDFKRTEGDKITVHGSVLDYSFVHNQNVSGGSGLDTQIFRGNDLIAITQDIQVFSFDLVTNNGV